MAVSGGGTPRPTDEGTLDEGSEADEIIAPSASRTKMKLRMQGSLKSRRAKIIEFG
ncbi:hypothetical protein [Methylobacterium aquaticum]|uniref:hypothetical protein n=1 Tax=Methylobacterium aquaticum TaxID=270351 RepID=UPI0019341A21|nr:hypothetical protein [Methylobacterium aquaticum]